MRGCLLCSAEENRIFARVESFGQALCYVQCSQCGLVQQAPDTKATVDPAFYAEGYRELYQQDENPTYKDLKIQEERARHLLTYLTAHGVLSVRQALDIGASAGVLLDGMKRHYGCQTLGIEPGNAYRQFAANKGHRLYASMDELSAQGITGFQLISLIHVIEHLDQPLDMLRRIRQDLLDESGWLLIETPNFYGHDSYEVAHLACYTPRALREMLRKAGFEVLNCHTHGVPRSRLLPLYLTVLARPLSGGAANKPVSIKKEALVRQKRNAAMLMRKVAQKVLPGLAWLPLPSIEAADGGE